jgi:hypothetical protein
MMVKLQRHSKAPQVQDKSALNLKDFFVSLFAIYGVTSVLPMLILL